MAHNLDTTNGRSAFVSAREDAWHRLGTVLPDAFTAEQAMEHGLLGGWNVRKTPLLADVDVPVEMDPADRELIELTGGEAPTERVQVPVPNRFAVVRDNPVERGRIDALGVVGGTYHPIQNEAHAEFLNTLVDESGAHFETAGAIQDGRKVFITMKLPNHINVGGVDRVDTYLAAINSHDGSLPFTIMVTPVRIVCQNTLNLAWEGTSSRVKIRHTVNSQASVVSKARETLDLSFSYLDHFQEEAERLINTPLPQDRFEQIITEAFGAHEEMAPAVATRRETQLDEFMRIFADDYTHEGLRETAWAGLNTLTEWADHYAPVRAEDEAAKRAENALLIPKFKDRARDLILSAI